MWAWLVHQLLGGYPRTNNDVEETIHNDVAVETGGESRDTMSYGYSLLRGKRSTMEDFHYAQFETCPGIDDIVAMFGVFDGHGGPDAAKYVKSHLFENLRNHKDFATNLDKATEEVYVQTDDTYLRDSKTKRDDGSTAVTAVVVGKRLSVANVGDSRAVLCRQGKAIQMSMDHKPNESSEKQRIENLGGMVVWAGTWRVGGVLAVSRAFGDRPLKKYVKADPHVKSEDITKDDEFVILASDGLWDVVSNEEAVRLVQDSFQSKHQSVQEAAEYLSQTALIKGSNDNISSVIIKFNFP